MVAVAEVIRIGSHLIVIECKVHDSSDGLEHGALVATADFSMMRVALRDKDAKEAADAMAARGEVFANPSPRR